MSRHAVGWGSLAMPPPCVRVLAAAMREGERQGVRVRRLECWPPCCSHPSKSLSRTGKSAEGVGSAAGPWAWARGGRHGLAQTTWLALAPHPLSSLVAAPTFRCSHIDAGGYGSKYCTVWAAHRVDQADTAARLDHPSLPRLERSTSSASIDIECGA